MHCLKTASFSVFVISLYSAILIGVFSNSTSEKNGNENSYEDVYYPSLNWSDEFDWKLFKSTVEGVESNVLISPLSLKIALAVLYEGAGGLTESEIQNVLNFESKEKLRTKYKQIIKGILTDDGISIVRLGTRLFLDSDIIPRQKYSSNIKAFYETEVEPTNFVVPEQAARKINNWVCNETLGYVSEIVTPEDLDDVVLLIANAVFFKGLWKRSFLKNNTVPGNFYTTPTSVVTTNYMNTLGNYYYTDSKELDAQILRIPYKGNKFAFFAILPNSKEGLPQLIRTLSFFNLKRNLYNLDQVVVNVTLPKFRFNFTSSLAKSLQKLGLAEMFGESANLPGIARGLGYGYKKLQVGDIRQKSGIEINEEGSIIFSSTEIQVENKFGDSVVLFNANRPFMFFVEDQINDAIIFIGKVENPLANKPVAVPLSLGENSKGSD